MNFSEIQQKRGFRANSICAEPYCNLDATFCTKHKKHNSSFNDLYRQAIQWNETRSAELGGLKPETVLITDISEQEGQIACTNTFNQMNECHTSIHSTLEDLFVQDPGSLQNQEEDDADLVILITEVRVEDRTNNKSLFEFANVKGGRWKRDNNRF